MVDSEDASYEEADDEHFDCECVGLNCLDHQCCYCEMLLSGEGEGECSKNCPDAIERLRMRSR